MQKNSNEIYPPWPELSVLSAIACVTLVFNLDRAQTWLPLAALIGGGAVGLLDDIINIRGQGLGVAGLALRIEIYDDHCISRLHLVGSFYANLAMMQFTCHSSAI